MSLINFGTSNPELNTFLSVSGFTESDARRLSCLAVVIKPQLPQLTERFYAQLQQNEMMQPYLNGRVDRLKQTHLAWLDGLFARVYDDAFLAMQQAIGATHVKFKVPPLFVSCSMSFLRAELPAVLTDEQLQMLGESRSACTASILRILDLAHYQIDSAYFHQVMDVMGISKELFQRLMTV